MQPFYGAASPPLIIGGILGPMGVGNAPAVVFLFHITGLVGSGTGISFNETARHFSTSGSEWKFRIPEIYPNKKRKYYI